MITISTFFILSSSIFTSWSFVYGLKFKSCGLQSDRNCKLKRKKLLIQQCLEKLILEENAQSFILQKNYTVVVFCQSNPRHLLLRPKPNVNFLAMAIQIWCRELLDIYYQVGPFHQGTES